MSRWSEKCRGPSVRAQAGRDPSVCGVHISARTQAGRQSSETEDKQAWQPLAVSRQQRLRDPLFFFREVARDGRLSDHLTLQQMSRAADCHNNCHTSYSLHVVTQKDAETLGSCGLGHAAQPFIMFMTDTSNTPYSMCIQHCSVLFLLFLV